MTNHKPHPTNGVDLRLHAETRLLEGTAPPSSTWAGGDALAYLHQLASDPSSATIALKFLHELQVHQIEVDLQNEQIEHTRAELAEQLNHFAELYERVAVGLLVVDAVGVIIEANPRALSLLHANAKHLPGRSIDSFLMSTSRPALVHVLASLNAGTQELSCVVHNAKNGDTGDGLRLTATRSQDGHSRLVALVELSSRDAPTAT